MSGLEREITDRLHGAAARLLARHRPHLTWRVSRRRRAVFVELLRGLADQMVGTTRVEAITLFESRLSPKGPT